MLNEPLDQPTAPLNPRPKMPLGKVALINFGIMLLYLTATGTSDGQNYTSILLDVIFILLQIAANFIVGLVLLFSDRNKHIGRAMMLAGLLVGVIGFGACLGKYSAFG